MRRAILAAVLLALAGTSRADATALMQIDATGHRGAITLVPVVSRSLFDVTVYERVDGKLRELVRPALRPLYLPGPDQLSYARLVDIGAWKCSRRTRTYVVTGRAYDGSVERGTQTVRTPSCANRLVLRVRPGHVTVRDTFARGDLAAQVCAPARCLTVRLPYGRTSVSRALAIRRGDRVVLRAADERVAVTVGAAVAGGPTVLTTGDSLMQSLDVILQDTLAHRASVVSDVKVGAALSNDLVVDFAKLARRQVHRVHPRATVIFLGANDAYDMLTPDGTRVNCCDAAWGAEYERRAHDLMATYAQGGAGTVIWLAVPAPRDPRSRGPAAVVDAALVRATRTVPGAYLLPADRIFTPGFKYRTTMPYHGRTVTVRERDGIHLTLAGARIAGDYVRAALHHFHITA